jgi:hypothetical protein
MIVLVLDEDIDDAFVADLLEEAGFKVVNCQSAEIAGHLNGRQAIKADAESSPHEGSPNLSCGTSSHTSRRLSSHPAPAIPIIAV